MKTIAAIAALALFAGLAGPASADRRCQGWQDGNPRAKQTGGYQNYGCPHFTNVGGVTATVDPYDVNGRRFYNQDPNNQIGAGASPTTK